MQRRSYYPQNQQIVSTITAASSSRPVTPNTIPGDVDVAHVESGNGSAYGHKPLHETDEATMGADAMPMNEMTSEKGLAC